MNIIWKPGDDGILFTGLSNYKETLEKDIKLLEPQKDKNAGCRMVLQSHRKTIERIDEILEQI